MKTNLNPIVFICSCFIFMSCNSFQYVQLKSDLPMERFTNRYYVEDEKVRVAFNFSGYDFPVNTTIYNLSDQPVYIDRVSTVYIQNGQKMADAMGQNAITLSGTSESASDGEFGFMNLRGSVASSADLIYIPAGNHVEMTRYPFPVQYDPSKKPMAGGYENYYNGSHDVPRRAYEIPNPRNYSISVVYSANRDLTELTELRADFYETRVYSSGTPPSNFAAAQNPSTYATYKNHSSAVSGVILGGLLLWAVIAAADSVTSD